MKGSTRSSIVKKTIYYCYKSRFLGLYFWSSPARAKKVAREILVGDILALIAVVLTITIAMLMKMGIINGFSLKQYPNSRGIILIILLLFAFAIGILMNRYVKKFLDKEKFGHGFDLSAYSKRSALPHFFLVIFSPLLYIFFYAFLLKSLTYLF